MAKAGLRRGTVALVNNPDGAYCERRGPVALVKLIAPCCLVIVDADSRIAQKQRQSRLRSKTRFAWDSPWFWASAWFLALSCLLYKENQSLGSQSGRRRA